MTSEAKETPAAGRPGPGRSGKNFNKKYHGAAGQSSQKLRDTLPSILAVVQNLKRESSKSLAGPCPKCGGEDRFFYREDLERFACRHCHPEKGDVIDFHAWLEGMDFKGLCEKYLPEDTGGKHAEAVNYLMGRKISHNTIQQMLEAGKIWQQPYQGKPALAVLYGSLNGTDRGKRTIQYIPLAGGDKKFKKGSKAGEDFFTAGNPKAGTVILTEAVINVLSVADAMPEYRAVALGGSTLTGKVQQLKDYEVVCFFDNDPAGKKATEAVARILPDCRRVQWSKEDPEGYDPNDLLKAGQGNRIKEMVKAAQPVEQEKPERDVEPEKVVSDRELQERARKILDAKTPCGTFDPSPLPGLISEYVNEICETTQAEPIIVASAVLSAISAVIGKKVFIGRGQYFQDLYANIWTITASGSGNFKTTGLNKGARIASEKEEEVRREISRLKAEIDNLEGGKKEVERQARELQKEVDRLETKSPVLPNRSTAEGLLDLLAWGQAGGIFLSEFGDWLKQMEQSYNAGLKSLFTDLFDVPGQRNFRTRTGGTITVRSPYITICGVSTLSWIKENVKVGDVGSGFFARFLLFYPPEQSTIPPALPPYQPEGEPAAKTEIKKILDRVTPQTNMTFTSSAAHLFTQIHENLYNTIESYDDNTREILTPYLKRWSPYILKIAMLNQLILEPGSTKITVDAINGAISVVEYAIKSTTYLFENDLGESEHQKKCRLVMECLARRSGKAKRKEILTSRTLEGGVSEYDYVLNTLEESGRIDVDRGAKTKNDHIYTIKSTG